MYEYVVAGLGGVGGGIGLQRLANWVYGRREWADESGVGVLDTQPWEPGYAWGLSLGVAAWMIGLVYVGGGTVSILERGVLVLVLVGCADADGRWGIIPNELTGAGLVIGGLLAMLSGEGLQRLGAALGLAGGLFVLREVSRDVLGRPGFGMGDVKLGAVLGLYLGWGGVWALYLAVLAAGILGGIGLLLGAVHRTSRLPFAPFMALGTAAHWFVLPFETVADWILL